MKSDYIIIIAILVIIADLTLSRASRDRESAFKNEYCYNLVELDCDCRGLTEEGLSNYKDSVEINFKSRGVYRTGKFPSNKVKVIKSLDDQIVFETENKIQKVEGVIENPLEEIKSGEKYQICVRTRNPKLFIGKIK